MFFSCRGLFMALMLQSCGLGPLAHGFPVDHIPPEMRESGSRYDTGSAASLLRQTDVKHSHRQLLEDTEPGYNNDGDDGADVFSYPYEDYRLDSNGLRVIIVPLGSDFPGLVSVQIPVIVGSRNELEPGKTGMAHFFEHMMFGGTNNVSFDEFTATYQEMGGSFNAFTSRDFTNYFVTAPAKSATGANNLETIMYVESDRFKYLNYTEARFKTEAGAILGEYNLRDSITSRLAAVSDNISYSVHPYRHQTIGTLEDILDMPNEYEYSLLFFERYYRPENTVLMIFGDVDLNETKALVDQYWGDWERGEVYQPDIPQEPEREAAVYQHVTWEGPTTPWISIGFNAANFSLTEPDAPALYAMSALVFSSTSDLYKRLVVDEQVVVDMSPGFFAYRDPSTFHVDVNVADVESIWYVRDEILKAFAKLRTELVSKQELERVTANFKNSEALSFTSTAEIAQKMAIYVGITDDPDAINQYYAFYDILTPQMIQEVANKYFTDSRLATVTLTFTNDTLPDLPSTASDDGSSLAGSVDTFVGTAASAETFPVDQVLLQSQSSQLVYFDIRFRVGSSDDPKGKEGLARLTTQMIDHAGSSSLSYEQVQDVLYPMAASWFGSTTKEYIILSGEVHKSNLEEYYDIVSGLLLSPAFREEDFNRVKTDTIQDIPEDFVSANAVALRAFEGTLFEGHPFGHDTRGTIASLANITLEDVKDFYATHFTKQNVVLGLSGAVSDEFVDRVNADLQRLNSGAVDKSFLAPPVTIPSNAKVIDLQGTQGTTVVFGYTLPAKPIIAASHPDYAALTIAIEYYGGAGFVGKLMREIRQNRGINYSNQAILRKSGRSFLVYIGACDTPEIAHFATRLAMYELNKLLAEGMDEESFELIRTGVVNSLPLDVDTQAKTLSLAVSGYELGLTEDYLTHQTDAFNEVTLDEVNDAAKKWLQDTEVTFIFVTPEAADMEDRLATEAASTITYAADDKPEEVLSVDEIVKDYPLGLSNENVKVLSVMQVFGVNDDDMADIDATATVGRTSNSNQHSSKPSDIDGINLEALVGGSSGGKGGLRGSS